MAWDDEEEVPLTTLSNGRHDDTRPPSRQPARRQRIKDISLGVSLSTLFFVSLAILYTLMKPPGQPALTRFEPGHAPVHRPQDLVPASTPHSSNLPAFDGFADFHRTPTCNLSTLDLHEPFTPKCTNRQNVLRAMSSGGRRGIDAPYQPRDCDLTWFSSAELCAILSKFSRVHFVGDSMMRFLSVSVHMLLRGDLEDGGRATWRDAEDLGEDDRQSNLECRCSTMFGNGKCAWFSAVNTDDVWALDAGSMRCEKGTAAPIDFSTMLSYPLDNDTVSGFISKLPSAPPAKPPALVFGHGLWNSLDINSTKGWLTQLDSAMRTASPFLFSAASSAPRLFVSPSAATELKPDLFVPAQNNIMLQRLEHAIGPWVQERGWDHLGLWNMSIQAASPDGSHGSMRTNLLKAMMVFNWLDKVEI